MKVCVPTENDSGMKSTAYGHFGSAPFFTVVDTESGKVEVIQNANDQREHGTCSPMRHLVSRGIDAVICRGMGRRAIASLEQANVGVYVTDREIVSEIVESVRKGEVRRLSAEEACQGRAGGHGPCR